MAEGVRDKVDGSRGRRVNRVPHAVAFASLQALCAVLVAAACATQPPPSNAVPSPSPSEPGRSTQTLVLPTRTPAPPIVYTTEPNVPVGGYRLTTEPARAPMDLTFRFVTGQGGVSSESDVVASGETAEIYRTSFGGIYRIMMNGQICGGAFTIKHQVRTLIVIRIDEFGGCALSVTGETRYE